MKVKYLLGSLLGGALLAACTAEYNFGELSASKEVRNSSPVFTVHFEDEDEETRAIMGDGGALGFQPGDLMTLYHGATATKGSWTSTGGLTVTFTDNFKGYENAIYEGSGSDEGFQLATKAMVKEGAAIMVYPADLHFENKGDDTPSFDLTEKITKQNAETRKETPYISEILYINTHAEGAVGDAKGAEGIDAGYGRKYDITLKRVAATLRLNPVAVNNTKIDDLKTQNKIVKGLKFTDVVLETTENSTKSGENKVFSTKFGITAKTTASTGSKKYVGSPAQPVHPIWANETEVTASEGVNAVEYALADDESQAVFTLLPLSSDVQVTDLGILVNKDGKGIADNVTTGLNYVKDDVSAYSDAVVTVKTNYGKVMIKSQKSNTENKVWYSKDASGEVAEGVKVSAKRGLAWFLQKMHGNETRNGNLFENEVVGKHGVRYIDVDMNDLNMNCLHIEDEQNLKDALVVLNTIRTGNVNDITFILDGQKADNNTKTEFLIQTAEGRKAYQDALTKGVKFALCAKTGEACTTVVMKNTAAAAEDVPARLEFVTEAKDKNAAGEDVTESVQTKDNINVRLEGKWNMTKNSHYQNVAKLEVADAAVLTMAAPEGQDDVTLGGLKQVGKSDLAEASTDLPQLINNGEIDVDGKVFLKLNTANYGKIKVGGEGKAGVNYSLKIEGYSEQDKVSLNNMIQWIGGNAAYDYENDANLVKRGVIENYGQLSCALESFGEINNYGLIEMENIGAVTLITTNAIGSTSTIGATMPAALSVPSVKDGKPLDSSTHNVAGIIKLYGIGNDLTKVQSKQGFIQQTITETTVDDEAVSPWANYIILDADVTGVGEDVVTLGALTKEGGHIRVLETKSAMVRVDADKANLNGLTAGWNAVVVRKVSNMNIPVGITMKSIVSYFKGQVYLGGTFNVGNYGQSGNTYFGGVANDRRNVSVTSGGKIVE